MEMRRFIKMNDRDLVATALENLMAGEKANIYSPENICLGEIIAQEDIPFGNKIALIDIPKGSKIMKYGAEIGESTSSISKGYLVHVHNLQSLIADIPHSIKKEIMRQMSIKVKEE